MCTCPDNVCVVEVCMNIWKVNTFKRAWIKSLFARYNNPIFFATFFFTVLMCILDEMHSSEITSKNFINLFVLLHYCWFLIQVFLKVYNNGPNIDLCRKPHFIFAKDVFFLSKLINCFRLFRSLSKLFKLFRLIS